MGNGAGNCESSERRTKMTSSKLKFSELLRKIKSENDEERRWAAQMMGELREKEGIPHLINLLSDKNTAVQEASADALVKIDGKEVAEKLVPLLSSMEASVRNISIEILEGIGKKAVDVLLSLLKDKDHDIRKFACDALGNIADPKATSYLITTLNDPNINVACAAAEALGKIGDKRAVDPLTKVLEGNMWLICSCVEALGRIGDKRAVESLMSIPSSENALVLLSTIKSLGKIGNGRAVDFLLSFSKSETLRGAVAEAIAQIVEKEEKVIDKIKELDLSFLLELLESKSTSTRKAAAFLLGKVKYKKAISSLVNFLSDEDEEIRETGTKALILIDPNLGYLSSEKKEEVKEILESLAYDNDEEVRNAANEALKRLINH
ncbi:MAG TPA: HEAT repeat domain-containing protein [candidate division WOR-3 bacterium]|uniref:HEAT repeat domain-containing protein n=1 Tax=candidate division WOR-3 bacterium TaxID=2052148 RepID=A0A7V5LTD1_UNCW3|nr:HEAT repeat domain-containing protein [candidate division WOR-3 bacterium]